MAPEDFKKIFTSRRRSVRELLERIDLTKELDNRSAGIGVAVCIVICVLLLVLNMVILGINFGS